MTRQPPEGRPADVTELLIAARHAPDALDQLYPLVYAELRRMATQQMRRERPAHTLGATGLVHEAYLRLVDQTRVSWRDRRHFFGIAARLMRQVLVDHARRRSAAKRGAGRIVHTASEEHVGDDSRFEQLVLLDDALQRLERLDPRLARIVEYRYFVGLTESEVGSILGVTPRTVQREWRKARAWLYAALYVPHAPTPSPLRGSKPAASSDADP